jgi:hypothetical protein
VIARLKPRATTGSDVAPAGSDVGRAFQASPSAIVLALLFLAFHIPFLPASLEDLDSINFALAIRRFDVAAHQPHPPGYPLFVALAKFVHLFVPSEAHALSLLGVMAGSLSVFALVALFDRFGATDTTGATLKGSRYIALAAALLVGTAPLFWFTAARPLSDMPGLAAALAVQALILGATTRRGWIVAAFLAGFAAGLRSQVLWLTVPLLVVQALRRAIAGLKPRATDLLLAFLAGILAWAIPLVILSGGPAEYARAVFTQGAEDLGGVEMLWTTRTPRQLLVALNSALVAPWAVPWVAAFVLALAAAGAVHLYRTSRPALTTLIVAFGPYAIFDLLFQESVTTRYALPLVVPMAFLAVWGLLIAGPIAAVVAAIALAAFDAHVAGSSLAAYASAPAPAFHMLQDMRAAGAHDDEPAILAMHRREDLDFRRPIVWTGAGMPRVADRLGAPPKHEWLELVKYWNAGGRRPVWFVADPLRADLALVDRRDAAVDRYRWSLEHHELIGGVRPDVMDWFRLRDPAWYLGEGWALTPETAGVAQEDGRGPGRAGSQGWIRRRPDASTMMIGGRYLVASGAEAHVRVTIDGRTVDERTVSPGFFLRLLTLPPGALDGAGQYAPIVVTADSANVAIEQFDAQPSDRVVFGFGEGWQEHEYSPQLGLEWRWMSEHAVLRVHAAGHALRLTLGGEPPSVYFSKPSHVVVRAGGRVVAEQSLHERFAIDAHIPAELVAGEESAIVIETDQMYVPAERSRRTGDRRHLALRVFQCEVAAQ